jgi:hypothetical protein
MLLFRLASAAHCPSQKPTLQYALGSIPLLASVLHNTLCRLAVLGEARSLASPNEFYYFNKLLIFVDRLGNGNSALKNKSTKQCYKNSFRIILGQAISYAPHLTKQY